VHQPSVSLLELRKTVGMVFQRPNPLPVSVYENVVFGLRIHAPSAERTRAALEAAVESALTQTGLWNDLKDRLDATPPRCPWSSSRNCASPVCYP